MKAILSILLASALIASATRATQELPTSGTMPIDLPTALKLGNARNFQIALAKARVRQAAAELRRKEYLLIPTLSVGASWHHSEGRLQESSGRIREVNRSSAFFGGGAGAVGAGPIMQPGLSLTANLADLYFAPLAARQNHAAMKAASEAAANQVALQIAAAYFDLARARAGVAVAGETLAVAVAQLARLLHLAAGVDLEPVDANAAPLQLADTSRPVEELVAQALEQRPEIRQADSLLKQAEQDLKSARYSPLLPNLSVGVSGGGMGGGVGGGLGQTGVRTDVNALVFWRWEGLGLGEKERMKEHQSIVSQSRHTRTGVIDDIIAEVRQSFAQVNSRRRQIAIAEEAVQSARESYQLNRARIYEKQGLPIEVLQAIQSLADARRLYVDTVCDYNQAQFRLLTALGQPKE
jgi:outer membrane protein TolC